MPLTFEIDDDSMFAEQLKAAEERGYRRGYMTMLVNRMTVLFPEIAVDEIEAVLAPQFIEELKRVAVLPFDEFSEWWKTVSTSQKTD